MKLDRIRPAITILVAASVLSVQAVLPVDAGVDATLEGRVVAEDGATPRDGVVVALHDASGQRRFASDPTDRHGAFRIRDAQPGRYTLVAEAVEGAFVAPRAVVLDAGVNAPVALALKPVAQDGAEAADQGGGDPAGAPPPMGEKKGLSTGAKWGIAGVVILAAAAAIVVVNDSEERASNF